MKMVFYDLAAVAGLGCLAYAGYQVHPALAWFIGGASLAYFGIAGAALTRKKERK